MKIKTTKEFTEYLKLETLDSQSMFSINDNSIIIIDENKSWDYLVDTKNFLWKLSFHLVDHRGGGEHYERYQKLNKLFQDSRDLLDELLNAISNNNKGVAK